jgi:hypothetical protein
MRGIMRQMRRQGSSADYIRRAAVDTVVAFRFAYLDCWNWLHRAGLAIEPDKTEVIFLTVTTHTRRPPNIWLADPSRALEYRVEASNTDRYLGIFFDFQLNWRDVRIMTCMTNRARSCAPPSMPSAS